jgi:hypothetical protein
LSEHWLPSDQAHVRSLIVEPRVSDWLQALAEKPKGQEATGVLKLASGHGPGQEPLCSEERILTMLKGLNVYHASVSATSWDDRCWQEWNSVL